MLWQCENVVVTFLVRFGGEAVTADLLYMKQKV